MKYIQSLVWFLLAGVLVSFTPHPHSEPIVVSQGRVIHRFFDTSPISPSGKYIALFRLPYEDKSPLPGDEGEVIVVDLATRQEVSTVTTRGWEVQLGANVQWGSSDDVLFYNDVDTTTWEAYAVCFNFRTGQKKRVNGTVFMASPDGNSLASYDLRKSRFAQVGYGVVVPNTAVTRNIGPVDNDGIYITQLSTNQCRMIASIRDIYEQTTPSIALSDPKNYEYYCFQVKWNPQGTRLLTTLQWTPKVGGNRQRAVITMKPDGTDIRTAITPEQWSQGGHHVNWMPDGEHLSMNLNIDGKKGIEIISVKYDGSDLRQVYPVGSGHPSYHPDPEKPYIITDAYAGEIPLKDDMSPIRLIDVTKQTETTVAEVYLPPIRNFEFRVDAHPAWDRSGRYVVYNGVKDNTRCVYLLDLVSAGSKKPVILLRSTWQIENIGDISHTPGFLALAEKFIPEAEVYFWPYYHHIPKDEIEMIKKRFPKVRMVTGKLSAEGIASTKELAHALSVADLFVNNSGPATLGWADALAFKKKTGKPYGVYGVTYGLYGIPEKEMLKDAAFVFFRDSVSLVRAKSDGIHAPIMEFGPDAAFATDILNEPEAASFLKKHRLEDQKFVCCIPKHRMTPVWLHTHKNRPFDAERYRRNEAMKEHDHAPMRQAIIEIVRTTGNKVLIVHEDETQIAIGKEWIYDKLPEDVKPHVVWHDHHWLPDEAISIYKRSLGLFSHEMHSPIFCIGHGIPAIVVRWEEQSSKGFMWQNIGLGDWLFDFDKEKDIDRYVDAVLSMVKDPCTAKKKAEKALEFIQVKQKETMEIVKNVLVSTK